MWACANNSHSSWPPHRPLRAAEATAIKFAKKEREVKRRKSQLKKKEKEKKRLNPLRNSGFSYPRLRLPQLENIKWKIPVHKFLIRSHLPCSYTIRKVTKGRKEGRKDWQIKNCYAPFVSLAVTYTLSISVYVLVAAVSQCSLLNNITMYCNVSRVSRASTYVSRGPCSSQHALRVFCNT